ncbi:MAG: YkuS family protein [Clostridia bacterium]
MVIAIQRGLDNIKEELESRGNEVFYIGESRVAEAVLYKEVDTHPYYEVNNIPSAASASMNGNVSYGALLVNVTNKSMEDIIRILDKRVYSPLI